MPPHRHPRPRCRRWQTTPLRRRGLPGCATPPMTSPASPGGALDADGAISCPPAPPSRKGDELARIRGYQDGSLCRNCGDDRGHPALDPDERQVLAFLERVTGWCHPSAHHLDLMVCSSGTRSGSFPRAFSSDRCVHRRRCAASPPSCKLALRIDRGRTEVTMTDLSAHATPLPPPVAPPPAAPWSGTHRGRTR
jgi:hypothetical protein